ncbi:hypothetical protein H2248_011466 [Termitomyces sp. 'cryptogamus']|nr:hypothetical protein H2248_011466 [Termitomyces sp. 'cryptogamus']
MDTSSSRIRTTNKTAYNDKITHATPSSSSGSSPSLTQSTSIISTSTPSTSPPLLATPPRSSRSRTRYPDLGRVPLHRRGTSKTYERLEDLLREAGYKETRVFTPEGERAEASSGKQDGHLSDQQGGVRNSVGAFVGFLAGFIPAASRSTSSLGTSTDTYSPPVSPLAQKELRTAQETVSSGDHSPMASSIESLEPTPRPNRVQSPSRTTTPVPHFSLYPKSQSSQKSLPHPANHMAYRASDQYHHSSFRRSKVPVQPTRTSPVHVAGPSYQHITDPQPSRAGAYLRHIASAPNMAKRHASAAQRQRTFTGNSESESQRNENSQPPLPPSWIKTVARAVLFGGMGAYIGGPSSDEQARSSTPRGKILRSTRSSLSQASRQQRTKHHECSGPSNTLNAKQGVNGELLFTPPELFTRIEHGRATTSASEVSRTRVVCRSAPASRAASPMRDWNNEVREKRDRDRRERAQMKTRGRGREAERDRRLPSLANTQTEGDKWVESGKRVRDKGKGTREGATRSRYLSGWGMDGESSDEGDGRISSSEEEEELDLARMLVNPKRQNSIVSLRRHLNDESNLVAGKTRKYSGTGRAVSTGTQTSRRGSVRQKIVEDQDWGVSETEDWGQGWVRKNMRRMTSEDDEDDQNFAGFLTKGRTTQGGRLFGSGRSGTGSSRLGIPGTWGLIGGGS